MKHRTIQLNVVRDEGGQAMTEFVIVIPIVLLFFFAMLQYFADVQAAQLGNYAAFCAARVYAVQASVDSSGAQAKAQKAAAMALAPIARPVPGEIGGDTGVSSVVGGALNALQSIMGAKFANFISGYAMAEYVRFNSSLLGGSVSVTKQGTPTQVDATINYPQPVFVPGLAGMWNFVTGDKIYYSMKPLRQGLTGIPSYVLPVYEIADQAQQLAQLLAQFDPSAASSITSLAASLPVVMLPYINIQSKCSMGYANWQYYNNGPRLHATDSDNDNTGTSTQNQGAEQNIQKSQQDQTDYQNAINDAKAKCQSLCTADSNLAAAHQKDDPIIQNQGNPPPYTADQVAAAQADLNGYISAQSAAKAANTTAQNKLSSSQQAVQADTGQSVPSMPCNCN